MVLSTGWRHFVSELGLAEMLSITGFDIKWGQTEVIMVIFLGLQMENTPYHGPPQTYMFRDLYGK